MRKLFLLAFAVMLAWANVTVAGDAIDRYQFDKSHTHIMFFIDHLGFSKMVGQFHDYSGGFSFDEKNPEASKIDVTIKTASIDTDVPELDSKLAGDKWFNSEQFPDATFVSTNIVKTGKKTGRVYGNFTLMGVTKPITLDVTFNKAGKYPVGDIYAAGFEARGKIFRSAFGMNEGLPFVGDRVDLLIHVEAHRIEPKPITE